MTTIEALTKTEFSVQETAVRSHNQSFTVMYSLESTSCNWWDWGIPTKRTTVVSLALVFVLASSTFAQGAQPQRPDTSLSSEQAREENAYAVGLQAYLWGFPLQFYGKLMPASEKADVGRLNDSQILGAQNSQRSTYRDAKQRHHRRLRRFRRKC